MTTPYFASIVLSCKRCNLEWIDWLPQHCNANIIVAAMRSFRCPKCKSKRMVVMKVKNQDA